MNLDEITNLQVILDFFSQQTELEKLDLYIIKGSYHAGKEFIFHILRSMPKLKDLGFHAGHLLKFTYTPSELCDFFTLTTNLESIKTNYGFNIHGHGDLPIELLPSTQYSRLKKLDLAYSSTHLTLEILKRCQTSLEYLSIGSVNDDIIRVILEAHVSAIGILSQVYSLSQVIYEIGYPYFRLN